MICVIVAFFATTIFTYSLQTRIAYAEVDNILKLNLEDVKKDVQDELVLTLKYGEKKERVISGLKCISKPGLRVYAKAENIPRVLNGLGIAIISTSKGVMTDKEARKENVGGEVLAYVW